MISGKLTSITMNGIEITGETDHRTVFIDTKNKIFCNSCGNKRSLKLSHDLEITFTNGNKKNGWLCNNCYKKVKLVCKEVSKYKK